MIHLAVNAIAIAVTTSSLTPKGLQQATDCMPAGESALQRMQAAVSSAAPGTIITAERATAATGGSQTARKALSLMCDPNLLPDLSRDMLWDLAGLDSIVLDDLGAGMEPLMRALLQVTNRSGPQLW